MNEGLSSVTFIYYAFFFLGSTFYYHQFTSLGFENFGTARIQKRNI